MDLFLGRVNETSLLEGCADGADVFSRVSMFYEPSK